MILKRKRPKYSKNKLIKKKSPLHLKVKIAVTNHLLQRMNLVTQITQEEEKEIRNPLIKEDEEDTLHHPHPAMKEVVRDLRK